MTTLTPDRLTSPETHAAAHHYGDRHLAHHFDTPTQQFEAAKLGMWLFLATEVLLFGGLFCLYAIFRAMNREVFDYGSQFLDTRWGLINTAVLITSSVTMAIGVTAAQRGQYRLLVSMLFATLAGAAVFMTVKYIEYHHKFEERLVWGVSFYESPDWVVHEERDRLAAFAESNATPSAETYEPNVDHGRELWLATCRSCHGVGGEGVTGQGRDLRGSEFIATRSDAQLLEYVKVGRRITDPLNTTGLDMPPKGGNPLLTDTDLLDVIAAMHEIVPDAPAATDVAAGAAAPSAPVAEEEFWIPESSLPPARQGPGGLIASVINNTTDAPTDSEAHFPHHSVDAERPRDAHLFFGLYFMMTGLHGIHVLVGMGIITWLLVRAIRGDFGPHYFTPVDLGGLYWHIVDIIWIFLFPLLYLIS